MSHPDPMHDPENVREHDFERREEYEEWLAHQHTHDDPLNEWEETE